MAKQKPSSTLFTPFEINRGGETFLIREARYDSEELQNIAWVAAEAFLDDVMMNYFGGCTEVPTSLSTTSGFRLYQFYYFLFKSSMLSRGRTIVAEVLRPDTISASDNRQLGGNIAAAAIWYAPREELRVFPSIQAGAHRVILNWGLRAWKRTDEYARISHKAYDRALKQQRLTFKDVWYLQCIFTTKRFEGRGLMSALIREGFSYATQSSPSDTAPMFVLESTSERSRARYLHMGFEIIEPWCSIGAGKVDSKGCGPIKSKKQSQNTDAKGLEGIKYTCLINWDCRKTMKPEP